MATERVRQLAGRAARSLLPVLIEGEDGVGKEALARSIHAGGTRRGRPFRAVRCDTPADVDSALLNGAEEARAPGTLFLDGIDRIPPLAQSRLADLLSKGGGILADGGGRLCGGQRLIAASNRRLVDLVADGSFHAPLFNHLNLMPIWLPPLRERIEDLPEIAEALLGRLARSNAVPALAGISRNALSLLAAQPWPGNIRALERSLLRAVMLSGGTELMPQDFPDLALAQPEGRQAAPIPAEQTSDNHKQVQAEGAPARAAFADKHLVSRYGVAWLLDERGDMRPIEALEEELIRFAISHYRGHMSEVARRLGIGRSTLYRKIKDYGIAWEPVPS